MSCRFCSVQPGTAARHTSTANQQQDTPHQMSTPHVVTHTAELSERSWPSKTCGGCDAGTAQKAPMHFYRTTQAQQGSELHMHTSAAHARCCCTLLAARASRMQRLPQPGSPGAMAPPGADSATPMSPSCSQQHFVTQVGRVPCTLSKLHSIIHEPQTRLELGCISGDAIARHI